MSQLTDLIAQAKAKDPTMGADLEREFRALSSRLPFGLNFERHRPEVVELPQRPIRKGDKVRILPERGSTKQADPALWVVKHIAKAGDSKIAELEPAQHSTAQHSTAQHSTAQHSTAQHSTAQHSTAQHSTAGRA